MMRLFTPLAAALLLPVVLACEDPDTHPCASVFSANASLVSSFCATYTTADITATTAIPSFINSACSSKSLTISEQCTCFVTGATATTSATVTASVAILSKGKKSDQNLLLDHGQDHDEDHYRYDLDHFNCESNRGHNISTLAGGSGVGGTTCTVTAFAEITASVSACSNILLSGITIPASTTLSVTVPSKGALLFAGTMTIEYTPDASYTPIVLKGTDAKVAGLAGAVINGLGADYWDGEGCNGGTATPDHLIKLSDMVSSSFSEIKIINWPTHLFDITGCTDMSISQRILDNSAGIALDSSGDALGHNTDAFDLSSTDGLYVSGATVYNQDDCVAVNSGSNMVFENM